MEFTDEQKKVARDAGFTSAEERHTRYALARQLIDKYDTDPVPSAKAINIIAFKVASFEDVDSVCNFVMLLNAYNEKYNTSYDSVEFLEAGFEVDYEKIHGENV